MPMTDLSSTRSDYLRHIVSPWEKMPYLFDLNSHLLPIFSLNPFTRLSQVQVGIINEHEGGKYYRPCQPNHPLLDMSVFSQVVLFLCKMPLQRIWVTKAFSCPVHHILNIRHERSRI